MVKKIFGFLLLILVIGMLPIAIAAEETVDENTTRELKAFTTPFGAQVRMLQLEKSITRNIIVGTQVISVIEKNHPEEDLTQAKTKLDEMEALLETVKLYNINDKDSNTLVIEFVAMKKQAIVITQEFKQITREILTAEDRQEIHSKVKDLDKNQLNNINHAIKLTIRAHNSERINSMFKNIGFDANKLIQRIEEGNITKQEVKEMTRNVYQDLNRERKIQAWNAIKENTTRRIIAEKALIQRAKVQGMERFLQMDGNRMQKLNEWMQNKTQDLNSERFNQITQRIQKRSEDLNNIINNLNRRRGGMQ